MVDLPGVPPAALELYEIAVRRLVWTRAELQAEFAHLAPATPTGAERGIDVLLGCDLLREADDGSDDLRVLPPTVALRTRLASERSSLVARQQNLEEAEALLDTLQGRWSGAKDAQDAQVMERVVGIEALRVRLEEMAVETRRETLSLLPAQVLTADSIEHSRPLDTETLARGVAVRTIVVESAARNPVTGAYLRWLSGAGAEIRTVPTLPLRMVVSDRQRAVLPIDAEQPRAGALMIRAPGLLTALVALFETVWHGATPLEGPRERPDDASPPELDGTEIAILRILAGGATDDVVSRQLGISARTVRRLVSGLMTRYDASSRFDLGVRLGARGWIAPDLPEPAREPEQ